MRGALNLIVVDFGLLKYVVEFSRNSMIYLKLGRQRKMYFTS